MSISIFTSFFLFFFFFVTFFFIIFFLYEGNSLLIDWQLLFFSRLEVNISFLIDWISISFSLVVFVISFRVIWFSYYYIFGDQYVARFTWLVNLFVMSIIFLIFIPRLVTLLIGWDGLGLISFCLVVYYQNFKSLVSGLLTVLINRVGDVMILLRIGWLISFGSWNFFFLDEFYLGFFVRLCLVLAGITKRAQFPFCSWLPAAMAAPTPVSALVHSSTLVTAGVYLIIRFWDFIRYYNYVVCFLQLASLFTIILSGFSAMFETDLKKIIALSTLRQLSVILFAISFGFNFLGLFHLYTHALFKALLFLCAGCLIHSFSHVQDLRHLGSCWRIAPCVIVFLNLANLALCGFPFFGGFYSKDIILETFLWGDYNFFFFFILFFATALTVGYRVRLTLFSSLGVAKINSFFTKGEEDVNFLVPLLVLGFGALFGGFLFYLFIFETECLFFFPRVINKNFIFFILGFGFFLGLRFFIFFSRFSSFSKSFKLVSLFGGSIWFLQPVSTQGSLFYPFFLSYWRLYFVDRGYIEYFGGQGLYKLISKFSLNLRLFSSKRVIISSVFIFFIIFFNYFV